MSANERKMKHYFTGDLKTHDYEECCTAHYDRDGKPLPQCRRCRRCGWVPWDQFDGACPASPDPQRAMVNLRSVARVVVAVRKP